MRVLPRSLLGQVMLALAAALLIAQAISASMLYRAATERRELAMMHAAAFQLLGSQRERGLRSHGGRQGGVQGPPRFLPPPHGAGMRMRLPRRLRYSESTTMPLAADAVRDAGREEVLTDLLRSQGIMVDAVAITLRPILDDPSVRELAGEYPQMHAMLKSRPHDLMIAALKQEGSDIWQITRLPVPPTDAAVVRTLVLQTLILFLVLVGLLYFVLRRITRPLGELAERTRRFAGAGAPEAPLQPSGPDDVRNLIEAHNAMQARIGSMIDEKDVMLGAIGHDLKTPLTALRVRIESVEDDTARSKMAATIEEITRTLDEILSLARIGRSDAQPEVTEISALAASVVEEFEDMGEPVTLETEGRIAALIHLTWLKRGLRNLITNALRYAGSARVSVRQQGRLAILRVEDDGPGIPAERLAEMLEPFTRGEVSRNRETGGAGLGLTLARAVAEQHGGTLVLTNRPEGGLSAEIRIPV